MVSAFGAEEEKEELSLSDREINRLDVFEDRVLSKADAAFSREQYDEALGQYDSFAQKFLDSPVLPYVLFRKGRCAQLAGKLPEAIEQYQQMAQRFPGAAKYIVPALYNMAECHLQGGASDEAVKAWAAIAENEEYAKSPLAAAAVAKLAAVLSKEDKQAEAMAYYERMAVSLGDSGSELAQQAIGAVVRQYVRTEPDEAKLREFYKKIQPAADDAPDDPSKSPAYWKWVREGIQANGEFSWSERDQRKTYFESWAAIMEGKFPESDEFQIGLASIRYGADRDRDKWAERLDEQFKKHQQEGDWNRIIEFVRAYKGNWTKIKEYAAMLDYKTSGIEGISQLLDVLCNEQQENYLAKRRFQEFCENLPFDELSNDDVEKLILLAHEVLGDSTAAKGLAEKLNFDGLSDADKLKLARKLLKMDGAIAEPVYASLSDQLAGKLELLEHYEKSDDVAGALRIIDELAGVEKYAAKARAKKAELLRSSQRYSEAIEAYKLVDNPPDNLWQIVECCVAIDDLEKAVEQLEEIESGYEDQAAKAAYRIACLYRDAEETQKHAAALRKVIDKYAGTAEAAQAEKEQELLGVPPAMPDDPFGR